MFSEHNRIVRFQGKPIVASGGLQTVRSSAGTSTLSDSSLARHLAGVSALAKAEGDVRLAEHLIDLAYSLASQE